MQLPKETKITIKDGDTVLLEEELIVLNGLISISQQNVDVKNPQSAEVWTNRLSTVLKDRYNLELSPTICYLIAVKVSRELGELQENFIQGL